MYLEDISLCLPTAMLIKDHLLNQEKGEVDNVLLSLLRPRVNWLLFYLTGIYINHKYIIKYILVNVISIVFIKDLQNSFKCYFSCIFRIWLRLPCPHHLFFSFPMQRILYALEK